MSVQEKVARATAIAFAIVFFATVFLSAEFKRAAKCNVHKTDDGVVHHVEKEGQVTRYHRPKQCPKCGGAPRE